MLCSLPHSVRACTGMQAFVEDIKFTKSASNFSIFDTDKAADWLHVKKKDLYSGLNF